MAKLRVVVLVACAAMLATIGVEGQPRTEAVVPSTVVTPAAEQSIVRVLESDVRRDNAPRVPWADGQPRITLKTPGPAVTLTPEFALPTRPSPEGTQAPVEYRIVQLPGAPKTPELDERAKRALEEARRRGGVFHYQWTMPQPGARVRWRGETYLRQGGYLCGPIRGDYRLLGLFIPGRGDIVKPAPYEFGGPAIELK